jgi:hypothetical protein
VDRGRKIPVLCMIRVIVSMTDVVAIYSRLGKRFGSVSDRRAITEGNSAARILRRRAVCNRHYPMRNVHRAQPMRPRTRSPVTVTGAQVSKAPITSTATASSSILLCRRVTRSSCAATIGASERAGCAPSGNRWVGG